MSRVSAFSSPFLVGFDDIERALEKVSKGSDGYPPYDIQRLTDDDDQTVLRITLAVAGFSEDELDITVEQNELVVRGRKAEEPERTYLYRGIAARQFQKTFVLAEGIEVLGATLAEGLLSIDLARPANLQAVKRIKVDRRT
jgi:HSP20 family molecular chaperone IbpA